MEGGRRGAVNLSHETSRLLTGTTAPFKRQNFRGRRAGPRGDNNARLLWVAERGSPLTLILSWRTTRKTSRLEFPALQPSSTDKDETKE